MAWGGVGGVIRGLGLLIMCSCDTLYTSFEHKCQN